MKKLTNVEELARMAATVRADIIKMLTEAGSGHTAGPLGAADIATSLYFNILNIDPRVPDMNERDRLFVSCGHYAPVWYAVMARAGYFPVEELKTLRKLGSRLQGHIEKTRLPGIESTAASLGQGLGIASGAALAAKMDGAKHHVYAFLSDGEHDEGSTWESAAFAGHHGLSSLTVIVDRNNIQIDGPTETVMKLEPMRERYESFGWHVIEIDGHNHDLVISACSEAKAIFEKPVAIIAHTVSGKGVDFMERDYRWHGKAPDKKQAEEALKQIKGG